jgi:hypothetical protein
MVEVAAVAGLSPETLRKIETGRAPTPAFFTVAACLAEQLAELFAAFTLFGGERGAHHAPILMPVFISRYSNTASAGRVVVMVEIGTDTSIGAVREAGRIVARALGAAQEAAAAGVRPRHLDEDALAVLEAADATSRSWAACGTGRRCRSRRAVRGRRRRGRPRHAGRRPAP